MGSYTVSDMIWIDAPPSRVHALIDDFHHWPQWSPWEGLDPDLQRTYTGPQSGVGSTYAWRGNKKAGAGSMEITESSPDRVRIALAFLKPFRSESTSTFDLVAEDDGTLVTWTMTGQQKGVMGLVGRLVPMQKFIGKDFEKGLEQLKAAAEG